MSKYGAQSRHLSQPCGTHGRYFEVKQTGAGPTQHGGVGPLLGGEDGAAKVSTALSDYNSNEVQ